MFSELNISERYNSEWWFSELVISEESFSEQVISEQACFGWRVGETTDSSLLITDRMGTT